MLISFNHDTYNSNCKLTSLSKLCRTVQLKIFILVKLVNIFNWLVVN